MRIRILKNGGESGSVASEGESYANIQLALADNVAKHITENPVDQQIESVIIRWKEPITREYEYTIEDD